MVVYFSTCHFRRVPISSVQPVLIALAGIVLSVAWGQQARGEPAATEMVILSPASSATEPNVSVSAEGKPSHKIQLASPVDAAAYLRLRSQSLSRQVHFQTQTAEPQTNNAAQTDAPTAPQDPCAALTDKPFAEFDIDIAIPDGELPANNASTCWVSINDAAGPLAGERCWGTSAYNWDATCLCHRPLYFEQINLERHGYGCCETLQPAASAAHFFGTVLALPYCMAVECPCECVYTLGHYRPGSCPPWRHHWPPCSPLAAAAEGGVWTGMVFLIP